MTRKEIFSQCTHLPEQIFIDLGMDPRKHFKELKYVVAVPSLKEIRGSHFTIDGHQMSFLTKHDHPASPPGKLTSVITDGNKDNKMIRPEILVESDKKRLLNLLSTVMFKKSHNPYWNRTAIILEIFWNERTETVDMRAADPYGNNKHPKIEFKTPKTKFGKY